ncbi:hypothetical protein [Leifsonia poae]|uniref:ATP synthase F0 subunit B n=1 Tax=Leifsonia poae TaxID=110933 RepID=A0A9W6M0R4_9MICO|nr:hypothetical protein [Leifsonia poae]GLJ77131.1 hypothetical protein GCM10017584_27050 [Leifsonia poae]
MTDTYSGAAPNAFPRDAAADQSTKQVVADQAGAMKDEVVDGGTRVLDTAKDQAADVVGEAKSQATDLLHQTQSELREQAALQQQRVADGLQSVSDELADMARNSSGGLASDLVSRAAARAGSAASYLDSRDPGSLLTELKSYAARRPGAFIALAVAAGAVAGRLTRSLASGASDASDASGTSDASGAGSSGSSASAAAPHADAQPEPQMPWGQSPVPAPEVREPGIQNASYATPDAPAEPTTPLYAELLTDRSDDVASDDEGQDPDITR